MKWDDQIFGREVRPSYQRLKFLFDTRRDLQERVAKQMANYLALNPRKEPVQLDQPLLRRLLYVSDHQRFQHDEESDRLDEALDPTDVARTGARYREVAVRKFVQGDPGAAMVGWDLLAALPLLDDEVAFVLGLSPQIVVPPDPPPESSSLARKARHRVGEFAKMVVPAEFDDLEQVRKLGLRLTCIPPEAHSTLAQMTRRHQAGLERVFVLPGKDKAATDRADEDGKKTDGTAKEPPEPRACVRLWQLNSAAVHAIRTARIRIGKDITDEHLVGDPSLAAGVYVTMVAGKSWETRAAIHMWLEVYLMARYPGRPVFAIPATALSRNTLRRLRAQPISVSASKIHCLGEVPS